MLVDKVIAFAILKALGKSEWTHWTKCPAHFVGELESKYTGVEKVIVNSYDRKIKIIANEKGLPASAVSELYNLLGHCHIKIEDGRMVMRYTW